MKTYVFYAVFVLLLISCTSKEDIFSVQFEVQSPEYSISEIPVSVEVDLPNKFQKIQPEEIVVDLVSETENIKTDGQVVAKSDGGFILYWIIPEISSQENSVWTANFHKNQESAVGGFEWQDEPGKFMTLTFQDKNILRYEYELDMDYPDGEHLTALTRPFHHIYDLQGENLITNGPEEGLYSHHRGIMIGWRNIRFDEQEMSFWGMEGRTSQKHMGFINTISGPVLAKATSTVHWNDSTGTTILEEERTVTAYRQIDPTITLLDFSSSLTAVHSALQLDGDPEHGGVQFRAHNDVAEGAPGSIKPDYYFPEDSIDPHEDYDLPWAAMMFGLNGKKYSIIHMDTPGNPNPTIWSAYRDYGRFGAFFSKNLSEDETLRVNYRYWMVESEMPDRERISIMYDALVNPPEVKILD